MRRAAAVAIVAVAVPLSARASVYNRDVIPFGEREQFVGNAGTAGEASSGSVYYNPAALSEIQDDRLSVSGSTYMELKFSTDKYARIDNTDMPYHSSGFETIPSAVVSLLKAGGWTLGYFVLVPESLNLSNQQTLSTPNTSSTLIEVQNSQDLWIGASAGRWVSDQWAIGLSVQLIQHKESETAADITNFPSIANTQVTANQNIDFSAYGLSATLGVLYRPTDWYQAGFRVQTPMIRVGGSGSVFASTSDLAAGTLKQTQASQDALKATYQLPLDMTLGSRFELSRVFALMADASFQVGADYSVFPDVQLGTDIKTDPTFRFNLGMEAEVSRAFMLGWGFYYDPSAIHSLDGLADGAYHENVYGATLGGFLTSGRVRTGLGGFYLWSSGELIPVGDSASRASASRHGYGATLTISYIL